MTLKRLLIKDLRNLNAVDIYPSSRINLFYGENGSGKTSVLEAVNILALGRSFRGHKHKALINNKKTAFVIFGRVVNDDGVELPIGVSRQIDGGVSFKVNGNIVTSIADMANRFPVQVINSDAFLLLEGAPTVRRQFMDWLVFHVEPTFFQLWKDCQRCLKHRNTILRRDRMAGLKIPNRAELMSWDQELVQLTEQIHTLRQKWVERCNGVFYQLIEDYVGIKSINIGYSSGWDNNKSYAEALEAAADRDFQLGYTHVGSNRADLKIRVDSNNAAEILSRGQQKLLVCALKIAQGFVFSQATGRKTAYLVDDLPAELDLGNRKLLANWLGVMNTQVFVTGVDAAPLLETWRHMPELETRLFHVEQGSVEEIRPEEIRALTVNPEEIVEASIEPPMLQA